MKTCDRCGNDSGARARFCSACGASLASSLIGEVLGERYRIQSLLGTGGMGHVYRAAHVVLGKPFAVKVLAPEYAHDRAMLEQFRHEALAASRLAHPHVVATVDFGSEDGVAYSVMELIEGRSLDTVLAENGTLDVLRALEIGRQIGLALGAAHRAGVVHRDVKPGNVIVGADFGLAVLRTLSDSRTTSPGVALGTPAYVSPEQVLGRRVDARADVYGLGAVLYEMVTGTPPFGFGDPGALTLKHAYEQPLPPSTRPGVAGLPESLDDLIMRMLDKRLSVRPPDGDAAAELLAQIAAELSAPIAVPIVERRERAIAVLRFADTDTAEVEGTLSEQVADTIRRAGGERARAIGDELIAHFDSADRALGAAAQVRELFAHPPAVAVHHGEVELVAAGGGIFGAPVNLALRLARLASPGELIASGDVKQRAGLDARAQLVPGGLLHLGGRSQPIPVYRLADPSQPGAVAVPVVRGALRDDSHIVDYVCECGARGAIDLGAPHTGMGIRSRCRDCSRQLSVLPYAPTGELPVAVHAGDPRPGASTDELSDTVEPALAGDGAAARGDSDGGAVADPAVLDELASGD